MPDDSRIKVNRLRHLIEIADKPPEDEEKDSRSYTVANDSHRTPGPEDPGVDLSQRISAFSFADDAPTWREMQESVVVVRDSRSLNHDHLMGQVLRARASANPALAEERDRLRADAQAETNARHHSTSWRFNAGEKDELSTYLKDRKKSAERKKMKGTNWNAFDMDEDDQRYDDDDDDDNDCDGSVGDYVR